MKLGLVGYPKVGKHTLFSLLTGQTANETSNHFQGLAKVRDPRFDLLCDMYKPDKETPAVIEFELLPDLDENSERNAQALKTLENVVSFPHLGSATIETRIAMGDTAINNALAFFEGKDLPNKVV